MIVSRYEKKNHMDFMKYSVFHRSPCGFFWFQDKKETDGKTKTERIGRANHVRKSRFDNEDGKSEYKAKMTALKLQMGKLQRQCKEMGLPIMIVFEGFDAAGKGMQIGKLIQSLDPRGFEVFTVKEETKEEAMHPFCGGFGRRHRKEAGWQYMMEAGILRCSVTGLKRKCENRK